MNDGLTLKERLEHELSVVKAENNKLKAALAKYADHANWSCQRHVIDQCNPECDCDWFITDECRHGWEIAEAALDDILEADNAAT
jgi:hypothetical protein